VRRDRERIQRDASRLLSRAGMPVFSYRGASLGSSLRGQAPAGAALLLLNGLVALFVAVGFRRCEAG